MGPEIDSGHHGAHYVDGGGAGVRILARAWVTIIWKCWQDGTACNPAEHGGLQRTLNQDQQPVAA